jgi:hypothetical protein
MRESRDPLRLRIRRVSARPFAAVASCLGMLSFQAGLWELGALTLLIVIATSTVQVHSLELLGFASIGVAAALGWVAFVQAVAAPCGFSSQQPLRCSVGSQPSVTSYLIAVLVLGIVLVKRVERPSSSDRRA